MVILTVRVTVQLKAAEFRILYGDSRSRQQLPASLVRRSYCADFVFFMNDEGESLVCRKGNLPYEARGSAKACKDETMVIPLKLLQSLDHRHSHVRSC